jgi:hypothetical protein
VTDATREFSTEVRVAVGDEAEVQGNSVGRLAVAAVVDVGAVALAVLLVEVGLDAGGEVRILRGVSRLAEHRGDLAHGVRGTVVPGEDGELQRGGGVVGRPVAEAGEDAVVVGPVLGLVVHPRGHVPVVRGHGPYVAVVLVELPRDDDDGAAPVDLVEEPTRRHAVELRGDVGDETG